MKKILIVFLTISLYKFLLNLFYFYQARNLKTEYLKWLSSKNSKATGKKYLLLDLIEKANISSPRIPISQPMGLGQVATFKASVAEQFPTNAVVIVPHLVALLNELENIFKDRSTEVINPLYWIETILHLPEKTLHYLGLKKHLTVKRIFNILWWLLFSFIGILKFVYEQEISTFLKKLFSSIFS